MQRLKLLVIGFIIIQNLLFAHAQTESERKNDELPAVPYLKYFRETAEKYDIPVAGLIAIAHLETNFNPEFSAIKLCGIMAYDATSLVFDAQGTVDCFDPKTNIDLAGEWLSELQARLNNDPIKALTAYRDGGREARPEIIKANPEVYARREKWKKDVIDIFNFYSLYYQ